MNADSLDLLDPADSLPDPSSSPLSSSVSATASASLVPTATPVATATVAIMTYNILAGGGPRLDCIEQVIRAAGADLIGIQEVTRPANLARLAERLGMHDVVGWSLSGWHVGLLSRWPILSSRSYSGPMLTRALLEAVVELPGGERMSVFTTHLPAMFSTRRSGEERRLRELDVILGHLRAAGLEEGAPQVQVLLGDFNSVAPGERFRPMAVLRHAVAVDARRRARGEVLEGHPGVDYILPPAVRPLRTLLAGASRQPALSWCADRLAGLAMPRAVIRCMRAAGYVDCYAALRPDPRTRELTCPADAPGGRIDYIWATPDFAKRLVACEVLTDAPDCPVTRASDHRPVLATFQVSDR
jgi:endonuclease/exonuclease/phosphatase family metal-dependent hydrolase